MVSNSDELIRLDDNICLPMVLFIYVASKTCKIQIVVQGKGGYLAPFFRFCTQNAHLC